MTPTAASSASQSSSYSSSLPISDEDVPEGVDRVEGELIEGDPEGVDELEVVLEGPGDVEGVDRIEGGLIEEDSEEIVENPGPGRESMKSLNPCGMQSSGASRCSDSQSCSTVCAFAGGSSSSESASSGGSPSAFMGLGPTCLEIRFALERRGIRLEIRFALERRGIR